MSLKVISHQAVEAAKQKWEYKVVDVALHTEWPEKISNGFGDDGWELVSVRNKGNTMEITLYFKRPKN